MTGHFFHVHQTTMKQSQFNALKTGDIIRHKNSPDGVIVTANYGDHVMAVRLHYVSKPDEWDLIMSANHVENTDREE